MRIIHTDDSLNVVNFAAKHQGWQTFKQDKRTKKAVARAVELGAVTVNQFGQFKSAR